MALSLLKIYAIEMSYTAFIAVDVQTDFISGSLGGEGRDKVIDPIIQRAREYDLFLASVDHHPPDHFSFADNPEYRDGSWPVHCVAGTPGAALNLLIGLLAHLVIRKGTDKDKEAYSAFDGQILIGKIPVYPGAFLHALGVTKIGIGGLCTDFCVKATALAAIALGFEVEVYLPACAGVAEETTRAAIEEMKAAGVKIVGES